MTAFDVYQVNTVEVEVFLQYRTPGEDSGMGPLQDLAKTQIKSNPEPGICKGQVNLAEGRDAQNLVKVGCLPDPRIGSPEAPADRQTRGPQKKQIFRGPSSCSSDLCP